MLHSNLMLAEREGLSVQKRFKRAWRGADVALH